MENYLGRLLGLPRKQIDSKGLGIDTSVFRQYNVDMKHFELAEEYICDVTVVTYLKFENGDEPNEEELLSILKHGRNRMIGNKDHDEFTKLRNQLEELGYIAVERGWWNGDRVLQPFIFNGKKFKKGEKFPCGAAMKGHLKFMK